MRVSAWGLKIISRKPKCVSHSVVTLLSHELYVAFQAPLSMEFSRQEYWRGLPFPSPGDLPDPGIEPRSYALQVNSSPSEPPPTSQKKETRNIF